ncbi:MAG: protein kinase domain-containing protein [Silanimonas sp.]
MAILRFTPSPDEEMSPEELSALLTSVMPDIPGYRVMRRIGKGGMSFVYLAVQESLDRQVAIKITAPEILRDEISKQRFEQEARTIAKLEHPCIVGIYEVGRSPQGLMYYVMPYLSKGHLGQRDLRNDEPRIIAVLRSLLSALGYAHTRGIVHRDVKAENVLFDNADRPVLADFGIALPFRSSTRITNVGFAVGSAAYMAPEQARGDNVDGRADLYAVGVLAYEMVTGHLPFQANDALALAVMHAHDPIPPLPSNRRHWQPFMSLAMAKTKEQRFRNAEQMLSALDELERRHRLGPATTEATPERAAPAVGRVTGEQPSVGRPVARWLGVGTAALALAAGAAWWMASRERMPDFLTIDGSAPTRIEDPIGSVAVAAGSAPAPGSVDADDARATPTPAETAPVAADPNEPAAEAAAAPVDSSFRSQALAYDPRVPAARELSAAQRQIARLRLSTPAGDNAVESLLAARTLAPRDPELPRLEAALIAAFGAQIDKALDADDGANAGALWQRAQRYVEQADLQQSAAWTTLVDARATAVEKRLADAAERRSARELKRATDEIALYGLDEARFADAIRAARVALLPRPGARIDGRGPAMRLVAAPTESRTGLAAMETEVARGDFLAFVQATGRPVSRCRGGFLERRTWSSPGFAQTARDPAVCVTAADAEAYAQWRGQRDGVRYRLPTAAEWGQLSQGAAGDCAGTRLNCDRREGTVPVGSGQASGLGLVDVGGNVREWLAGGRQTAGGGWRTTVAQARAGATQAARDERGQDDLGFRLVRDVSLDELLDASPRRPR